MVFIWLIIVLAAADLLIKAEIESRDGEEFPRPFDKGGLITLHKSHNAGLPFGFLKKYQDAVRMIPIVTLSALGGILFWLLQKKGHLFEKTAFAITIGGALSNLYDRLVRHYVVDYFSINCKAVKKVIFNLGDIMIFTGSLMVLVHEIWSSLSDGKQKKK
ncbi:signal peptidase II [Clostridium sp. AM58-1XD]|uniref:signal peptidase II n=1 Tax=Clostridium sp. AM58-1XD TaxID=2292307 RepID=UPI000E4B0F6B|nr:signal peptidase II [Clostridium sp. AM58-1XD]RGY99912.1 signal peptidase II [Clostridium sp. AM58-1XD]